MKVFLNEFTAKELKELIGKNKIDSIITVLQL